MASASVATFHVSASSLSDMWDISFDVRNRITKVRTSYKHVQTLGYYKHVKLSRTNVAPFLQGTKNKMILRTTLLAMGAYADPLIINALNMERAEHGSVNFTMELTTMV